MLSARNDRTAHIKKAPEGGPAGWPNSKTVPEGKEEHPVTSVSYSEAQAFVNWCNGEGGNTHDWMWSLPPEDHWEFAARSEQGFIYPWGDAFDLTKCNSLESGIGDTSEVASLHRWSPISCFHVTSSSTRMSKGMLHRM
jgi:formylglycine-generating enzyme required for sulfatase activity